MRLHRKRISGFGFPAAASVALALAAACGGTTAPEREPDDEVVDEVAVGLAELCDELTGSEQCAIQPVSSSALTLYLYFGTITVLAKGKRTDLSCVSGTIKMTPASSGADTGTFVLTEEFTKGAGFPFIFSLTGTYEYVPASDIYEFEMDAAKSLFGGGTLTAANNFLIGTLTRDGSTSTTFDVPYTPQ